MSPVLSLVTVGEYTNSLSDTSTPAMEIVNIYPALSLVLAGFYVDSVPDSSAPVEEVVKSAPSALNGEHDRFCEWHLR